MKNKVLACSLLLLPVLVSAQKKVIHAGALVQANDIINSTPVGAFLQFEEQFEDQWTFNLSVGYARDSVNGIRTMIVNSVEKSVAAKYQNNQRSVELSFRHYFDKAFNGLFIGPMIGVHNFDLLSAYVSGTELLAHHKKSTALIIGITSGLNYKIYKALHLQIAGNIAQGMIKSSGYSGNLIISGTAGIGITFSDKKSLY